MEKEPRITKVQYVKPDFNGDYYRIRYRIPKESNIWEDWVWSATQVDNPQTALSMFKGRFEVMWSGLVEFEEVEI